MVQSSLGARNFHIWSGIKLQIEKPSDWLTDCCWPSPAQWFLVPSPTGLMSIFYCLTALGAFWLTDCCWASPAQWFMVRVPRDSAIFYRLTAVGVFRTHLSNWEEENFRQYVAYAGQARKSGDACQSLIHSRTVHSRTKLKWETRRFRRRGLIQLLCGGGGLFYGAVSKR
jgi:hypothetical protein